MLELTDFGMIYSVMDNILVLDVEMKASSIGYIDDPQPFPDMQLSIRANIARELTRELLRYGDTIDMGMNHTSLKFID